MNYLIKAYYWNPNGTNDIEIVEAETGELVEFIEEALFGVNLDDESEYIDLEVALRSIAVSPVEDGTKVERLLGEYFTF